MVGRLHVVRVRRIVVGVGLLLAGLAGPVRGAQQTLVLQQGLGGYSGARDTWVSSLEWDTPRQHTVSYGLVDFLRLSRNETDNPLLAFDLGAVPLSSAVASATLELYNTTAATLARRVDLHLVLRGWDEGNQDGSPVDAPGDHGATGDFAFAYYPGEGANVPWGARAMAAGSDFEGAVVASAHVTAVGWYAFDVTAEVREWVKLARPNHGLVLRDATGYQDGNPDWRDFHSAQSASAALRPRLTVVFDPDTPLADAGPDHSNLSWNGGPVTLDGSRSHDRPGGDDAALRFLWRVVTPAFGSALGGAVIGAARICQLVPDVPGEWELELEVTNELGLQGTDRVRVRVLRLQAAHPRIWLDAAKLVQLAARAVPGNPRWDAVAAEAGDPDGAMLAQALHGVVSGTASSCQAAIAQAVALAAEPGNDSGKAGDIAVVYDWCHAALSPAEKAALLAYFGAWPSQPRGTDTPGWGNYWPRWSYSTVAVALAAHDESAVAAGLLDEFRHERWGDVDIPLHDRIAEGGAWPEGTVYDWIANAWKVKALEAWRTGTGEDLFRSTRWLEERLGHLLLQAWPGVGDQWGLMYHPYPSTGDAERNRGSMENYGRVMALLLRERFPESPVAEQLAARLSSGPTAMSASFQAAEELIWFDPAAPQRAPALPAALAAGTGTLLVRSGWPSGAPDTDPSATWLSFQCGDHFTYHQHFDQGSFGLFKGGDLLIDSGVYSGDGLSYHDQNYYVRTIAHNTLIVRNPAEDFQHARPDASSNDGGQRTVYPGSRSPGSISYFDDHLVHYDTGDLLRYQDDPRFTYALGDATKAYNNPGYNQAMDTFLSGNTAKVSRFQRELCYLRPTAESGEELLLLYDRVGVTGAGFSGASTKLLFHMLPEPALNGTAVPVSPGEWLHGDADLVTVTGASSSVLIRPVLPATRNLRKVGGRGVKAFEVFGAVYDWHWDSSEPQPRPLNDFEDVPYGEWRVELEPADSALEHAFLTVVYPTTQTSPAMPATVAVTSGGLAGVHVATAGLNRLALFSAAADGASPAGVLTYSYTPTARTLHTLLDLTPSSRYVLATSSAAGVRTVTLTPDAGGALEVSGQGALAFTVEEGAAAPVASFTVVPAAPAVGQPVVFADTSTGSPTARSWQLGDGATSTEAALSHVYATPGKYWVGLTVSGPGGSGSASREVVVAATGPADVGVALADAPDPVPALSQVSYQATVANHGGAPASGVAVVLQLPAGLEFELASASQGTCSAAVGSVTCVLGALPPGTAAAATVVATATAPGTLTVTATASAAQDDPDAANNVAFQSTTVGAAAISPAALEVDFSAGPQSNGNGVLEPGEQVGVAPSWANHLGSPQALAGTATALAGPGAGYGITDTTASYGTVAAGATVSCRDVGGDCYAVALPAQARPAVHWDLALTENALSEQAWTVHVGGSFADVAASYSMYPFVEALLHRAVTTGCTATSYCPDSTVTRAQMAMFLARSMAGSDGAVPTSGTVPGRGGYQCGTGGSSVFTDLAPTASSCRHTHYIASRGVTLGCDTARYCPASKVPRGQMAMFVARAIAGSDGSVPESWDNPANGRSYSCVAPLDLHFSDVPATAAYCRHAHYLWARGVVDGCSEAGYCPASKVSRGQMAKFLVNGFGLLLYGP